MNILVTGGAGYVGYSVSQALAEKYPESKIVIYDNFSKGKLENISLLLELYPNIVLVPWENADIRDYEKFEQALIDYKPEIAIHFAAIVDAFATNREGKDLECRIVNNVAAVNVANLCKKHGVKTFIFQSSVSIYSRGENLKEDSPKEPLSTYGLSKYKAEQAILKLDDGAFNACAIRSATIIGYNPSFRYETIINLMCIRSVYGMNTAVFESALKNPKSYLSLQDEAAAIIFLIKNIDKSRGEAYNVSSFDANLEDVVGAIEDNNVKVPVSINKEKTINQQVYTVNSDKIKELGFMTSGNLKETIGEIIAGVKKRQEINRALI